MTLPVSVSMIALIANPEKYHDKVVRVIGFVVSKFEAWGIFVSEGDYRHGILENGIWLRTRGTAFEEVDEAYATVEGPFDATSFGHLGRWSGTIADLTRLDRQRSGS